ncbi:MAG: hypothetical protein PWR16_475 [Methanoculleus sp.]|nr:hypothetical protein [Methanoculleus sp.]
MGSRLPPTAAGMPVPYSWQTGDRTAGRRRTVLLPHIPPAGCNNAPETSYGTVTHPVSPESPPAEHLHDHRHHPAHDPAGPGADRGNSSALETQRVSHAPLLAPCGARTPAPHLWCSCSGPSGHRTLRPVAPRTWRCSRSGSTNRRAPHLAVLPLRFYEPSRLTDPLHVPVRLVRSGSRVVFSSVILGTSGGEEDGEEKMADRKDCMQKLR